MYVCVTELYQLGHRLINTSHRVNGLNSVIKLWLGYNNDIFFQAEAQYNIVVVVNCHSRVVLI